MLTRRKLDSTRNASTTVKEALTF